MNVRSKVSKENTFINQEYLDTVLNMLTEEVHAIVKMIERDNKYYVNITHSSKEEDGYCLYLGVHSEYRTLSSRSFELHIKSLFPKDVMKKFQLIRRIEQYGIDKRRHDSTSFEDSEY